VFVILRGARNTARKIAAWAVRLLCATTHPLTWNIGGARGGRKTKSFHNLPSHHRLRRPSILSLAITPSGHKITFFVESSSFLLPHSAPHPPCIFFDRNIMTASSYFFSQPGRPTAHGRKNARKEIPFVRLPSVDDFTHVALP